MRKSALILLFSLVFIIPVFPQKPAQKNPSPEGDFVDPPLKMRPYVWWHWMANNISAEGITKDLESMKNAGIAGATIFNISSNADKGGFMKNSYTSGITYHNSEWWKLVKHAAVEADRLGLEIGIHNCVGYTGSGGPWITPERSMQQVVWSSVSRPMPFIAVLPQPPTTLGFYRDIVVLAVPDGEPSPEQIMDISSFMKRDGSLDWDVPPGAWTIFRFGHTSTGRRLRPVPEDLNTKTLDADKMSDEAMAYHMHQVLDPLKENLGPLVGRSFKHILFDSYESENQNWTPKMREEFRKRRGYDIIPWLPVLAGRNIGGKERADRFLWDLKTTISELVIENAYLLPKKMINEMGMESQVEPYGGPFDEVSIASAVDLLMVEFWINKWSTYGGNNLTAPSGRALGKTILAAEAFTGDPAVSQWTETPAFLKTSGDTAFAYGVNRLVLHHWTHQPFPDNLRPGMCFGWWGSHFGRNQTWYEPGKAWLTYLSRCQSLLQRGEQVSDYCVLEPESPFAGGDAISTELFLNHLSVVNGKLVLATGRSYSLMVIPDSNSMLPEVARKLKQLIADGAVVIGRRPEKSPSMQGWPVADNEVKAVGKELWGEVNGTTVKENKFGKGRVIYGRRPAEVLKEMELNADLTISGTANNIHWNHRRDGSNDYYFIVNAENKPAYFTVAVRIEGKLPEFWYPETGKIVEAVIWRTMKGSTDVDIRLKNNESVFLVFRRPSKGTDRVMSVETSVSQGIYNVSRLHGRQISVQSPVPGKFNFEMASGRKRTAEIMEIPAPVEITGNWNVSFQPGMGAPESAVFDRLVSWTESSDTGIKYYSGTAIYRNEFSLSANTFSDDLNVILDLGKVRELADVSINGRKVGVLWYNPFRTDITGYLKPGLNTIEVAVTNTWVNRMIGDERFPDDCVWGGVTRAGRSLAEFPEWLINGQARPSKERVGFSTWNYFTKDSPLMESGLMGPVRLVFEGVVQAK